MPLNSFTQHSRPFKVGNHWTLAYHMECDTPTIVVNQDYQILLEELGLDGSSEEYFVAEHFQAFLDLLVIEEDE